MFPRPERLAPLTLQMYPTYPSPQLCSHARPFPDFRYAHAPVRQPTHRHPVQPRSSIQSRSGIGYGSARLCRRPERRSADRPSACERGLRSCATCPVARRVDGRRRAPVRCSVRCRTRHRQPDREVRNRARRSSCAAADRRRWTGCRSPRSRHLALWARIFPLRFRCWTHHHIAPRGRGASPSIHSRPPSEA